MSTPQYSADGQSCKIGNKVFTKAGCFSGDYRQIGLLDPLQQAYLRPNIMGDVIYTSEFQNIDKLVSQLSMIGGNSGKTTTTRVFYSKEQNPNRDYTVSFGAVATPANQIVAPLIIQGETAAVPQVGYKGFIKKAGQTTPQTVNITAAVADGSGGYNVTLKGINGELIDFTGDCNVMLQSLLREKTLGNEGCIITDSRYTSYPSLVKHHVQGYERGICLHEDQINGMAFGKNLEIAMGIDPMTGKEQWQLYIPEMRNELIHDHHMQRSFEILYGERDVTTGKGVDGLFTTAERAGKISFTYDANSPLSLEMQMRQLARKISVTNSPKSYMIIHDAEYGWDWNDTYQALASKSGGHQFKMFGDTPANFKYPEFNKNFEYSGVKFHTFQMDAFNDPNKAAFLHNGTAVVIPAESYRTSTGGRISPIEYYNLSGASNEYDNHFWMDDTRKRGCRTLNVYKSMMLAPAFHGLCNFGMITKNKCN